VGDSLIPNCDKNYNMDFRANYPSLAEGSKSLISGEGVNVVLLNAIRY